MRGFSAVGQSGFSKPFRTDGKTNEDWWVADVAGLTARDGDKVIAGQPFAKVGNNGFGRNPYVHEGAWRDKTPLQIRFDLRAAAKLHKKQTE